MSPMRFVRCAAAAVLLAGVGQANVIFDNLPPIETVASSTGGEPGATYPYQAQAFHPAEAANLDSVVLLMSVRNAGDKVDATIWSGTDTVPTDYMYTLTGPAGGFQTTMQPHTFSAGDFTVEANHWYWVVLMPVSGWYSWYYGNGGDGDQGVGSAFTVYKASYNAGSSTWEPYANWPQLMEITTDAPEPSTLPAIALLGLLALRLRRLA